MTTVLNLIIVFFAGKRTSRDLISSISSSSFLGALPRPEPDIHCCSVLHNVRQRKRIRIWAWVFFLLMEDGPHAQIMLCRAKGIFRFRKLDVGIPQDFRIGFIPVGAKDIAATRVPSHA